LAESTNNDTLETMVELTIQLPEGLAQTFGDTAETQRRRVIEDVAVEEYRLGRLSHRQVGELLGLDYWKTESFLATRKVPLNYSIADLDADRKTLATMLNEK
jgi:predicted HTH domain antitoxin